MEASNTEEIEQNAAAGTKKMKMDEDAYSICTPISELSQLWSYVDNPPTWIKRTVDLVPRSDVVVKHHKIDCHVESKKFCSSERVYQHSVPRTLVCHDMKGGYLDDRFINPVQNGSGYTFYRWAQIDLFVYFSHHLVTIPPLFWINNAHSNGVKILGTFITEWEPGMEVCLQILANNESVKKLVDTLVAICINFKFDGWLINIENPILNVNLLRKFVDDLSTELHLKKPGSLVIWYDSVISNGDLKWQNELNHLNRDFFDVCDGIFLNYSWNEENLQHTMEMAEHRRFDVYVGVDVFGRNFYGGGNFNTYMAVEKIREYNLSMAIFAQGWTHETLLDQPKSTLLERFFDRDNAFWRSLWPFLYTHPITTQFQTTFYTGVEKEWFKLGSQELQLSRFLESQLCPTCDYKDIPTLEGTCDCLQLHYYNNHTSCLITRVDLDATKKYIHHLFNCDISVNGKLIFYYYSKPTDYFNIILLIKNLNNSFKKVVCYTTDSNSLNDNSTIIEVNPLQDDNQTITLNLEAPSHWQLRSYMLSFDNAKILEIGAEIVESDSICLYGIGFKNV